MDKYDVAIAKAAAAELGGFKEITIEALKEKQERDNPKPLTLDELRERDGCPVWIFVKSDVKLPITRESGWGNLIITVSGKANATQFMDDDIYFEDDYEREWLAFDHPPKEATP